MTDEERAEIEAKADAATPGPWLSEGPSRPTGDTPNGGDFAIIGDDRQIIGEAFRQSSPRHLHDASANASFLASARSDVPALVAECRKLQHVIECIEWRGTPAPDGDPTCPWCGARSFDVGDGPPRQHYRGCLIVEAIPEFLTRDE